MNLPRLQARHFLDNPASANVLRKIGFRPTNRVVLGYSRGRGQAAPCALFEEGVVVEMRPNLDRMSTRLNSSHYCASRMPSSACIQHTYQRKLPLLTRITNRQTTYRTKV